MFRSATRASTGVRRVSRALVFLSLLVCSAAAGLAPAGCAATARVELAAADMLEQIAEQTDRALAEYDADLRATDRERERGSVLAFVDRLRRDGTDPAAADPHVAQFIAALDRLRDERETALDRYRRAADNVAALRETARGLRRLGLDALRLDDEARRYLGDLLDSRGRASAAHAPASAASPAADAAPRTPGS